MIRPIAKARTKYRVVCISILLEIAGFYLIMLFLKVGDVTIGPEMAYLY